MKIKIDIVSDVVCPWCYVGEHNLENAVEQMKGAVEFDIHFKPFQLSPEIPEKGLNRTEYMVNKFGSEERLKTMDLHMRQNAAAHGLAFNPEKMKLAANTFNAHRLIWLAEQYGVQHAVAKALFLANFAIGDFVGDISTLKNIGIDNGIPAERLDSFYNSDEGKQEVSEMEEHYRSMGISGVPAFIINDRYLISGAQPTETFVDAFKQISQEAV